MVGEKPNRLDCLDLPDVADRDIDRWPIWWCCPTVDARDAVRRYNSPVTARRNSCACLAQHCGHAGAFLSEFPARARVLAYDVYDLTPEDIFDILVLASSDHLAFGVRATMFLGVHRFRGYSGKNFGGETSWSRQPDLLIRS